MSKKNALRSLKRHARLEVVEKSAVLEVPVSSPQARKALKRRKLVSRP
jgi:hypothetical protein